MESVSTPNSQPATIVETNNKQSSFLVTLLSVLLLISSLIAGFFAWKTQQLVSELRVMSNELKPTPTATSTPDPTADWKTYTDNKLSISFNYPENLTIRMLENGVVQFLDTQDEFVFNFNGIQALTRNEFNNYKFIDPQEFIDLTGRKWRTHIIYAEAYNYEAFFDDSNKITQVAFQGQTVNIESLANQILSTFKFIEPVASTPPLPVACTMEAKICPDGSAVGRSGPKCEFAPCPTLKN